MSRRKKRRIGKATEVARPAVDAVEFDIVDDVPASPHAVDVVVGRDAGRAEPAPRPPVAKTAAPPARRPTVGESKRSGERRTSPPARAARPPEPTAAPRVDVAPVAEAVVPEPTRVHAIAPRDADADFDTEFRHDVHTVGELLQQAREARGLSLEETSARTRIALKMLRHLEDDHFDEFPADAYVKGFLRSYGGFLGLEVGMLIRRYEAFAGRLSAAATPEVWEEHDEPVERRPRLGLPVPGRVLAAAGGGVALVVLAWLLWSQGGSGFGLRPRGGLDSIEQDLRGAQTTGTVEPQTASVDRAGVEGAALPVNDATGVTSIEDAAAHVPAVTPAITGGEGVHEDTAPKPPAAPAKPAVTPIDSNRQAPASALTPAAPAKSPPAAVGPKPAAKPAKKPAPAKKETRTSPEDAAGPPR